MFVSIVHFVTHSFHFRLRVCSTFFHLMGIVAIGKSTVIVGMDFYQKKNMFKYCTVFENHIKSLILQNSEWNFQSSNVTRQVKLIRAKIGGKCLCWKIKWDNLGVFRTMCTVKMLSKMSNLDGYAFQDCWGHQYFPPWMECIVVFWWIGISSWNKNWFLIAYH